MVTADGARDRPGAGDAGRRGPGGARGRDEPGAAQARRGRLQPGGAARPARRGGRRADLPASCKAALLERSLECLADLRRRFDVVICEGAGSPAEINLRDRRHRQHGPGPARRTAGRGGRRHRPRRGVRRAVRHARAAAHRPTRGWSPGSWSTSSAATRGCSSPAWTCSAELTGRPVLGVLPWLHRPVAGRRGLARPRRAVPDRATGRRTASDVLRVAVAAAAADVQRHRRRRAGRRARRAGALTRPGPRSSADADLVVLPGTRATVADLALAARDRPGRRAARARAAAGQPVLGHLRRLPDAGPRRSATRSSRGPAPSPGSGCCRPQVAFAREKMLGPPGRRGLRRSRCDGYEIHHGVG